MKRILICLNSESAGGTNNINNGRLQVSKEAIPVTQCALYQGPEIN